MSRSKVVRRGRIKVDARRAVAKLRDHLLLDPDTWPLEVVRVAALGGATGVRVTHDADDLALAFDGEALPADALPRLLDHALESSRDERTRRLRLLAIAVNASLTARTSTVEVAVRDGDEAVVARFAPGAVRPDRDDGDGEPAERPDVARRGATHLGRSTVRVAARKGFGWGTFVRFTTGRPLREAQLLAAATRHAPFPVVLDPPLPGEAAAPPVLRLDLEPHGVPGGVIEVLARHDAPPELAFLELGVVLAAVPLASSDALRTLGAGVHLPVVARVDAPSWATNASRSQVHERDARRVQADILGALPAVARALARAAGLVDDDVPGVVVAPAADAAERALSAVACCVTASDDGGPLDFVLDLPIVRDAIGRPLTPRALAALVRRVAASAGAERIHVHRGAAPLPAELGPFAGEVPWLRGHAIERLLDAVHVRDFAEVHDEVARGLRRREARMALPAREPHVPAGRGELFRLSFTETDGDLAGLTGELVVHLRRERPLLRVFVDERPFATFHPTTFLPLDAAVAWPGRLRADLAYESVIADGAAERAAAAVIDRASRELALRADRLAGPDAPEEARALARAALAASAEARGGPLADAPLWRTAEGGWLSLRAIDAATRGGALAFVQEWSDVPRRAPDGRPVVVLGGAEAACLTQALARDVVLVPYAPALHVDDERARRIERAHRAIAVRELSEQGRTDATVVRFAAGTTCGLVATADEGVLVRTHAGVELSRSALPLAAPVLVIVEDATIVPTPGWDGVRSPPPPEVASLLTGLVQTVAKVGEAPIDPATRSGEAPVEIVGLEPTIAASGRAEARAWALAALAAGRRIGKKRFGFAEPLAAVPVALVLGDDGTPTPASLAAIRQRHTGATIPFLREAPDFPTFDWRPVLVVDRSAIATLAAALDARLEDATAELPRRREAARTEIARRELVAREVVPLLAPVPGAPLDAATGSHPGAPPGKGVRALVALTAASSGRCTVRWSGRPVTELTLDGIPPGVAAIVDTPSAAHLERWVTLSAAGRDAAQRAVVDASRDLALALVAASDDRELAASPMGRPGALELLTALLPTTPSLTTALRLSSVLLPGALGPAVTLARAVQGDGPIPIARETFDAGVARHVVDPPVLVRPVDRGLEALLLALGPALDDVTGALRRLSGAVDQPVVLDGAPLHQALRASLAELGSAELTGEIELTDEATSTVRISLHDGSVRSLAPALPFAIRAAARPTRLDTRGRVVRDAATVVEKAAWKLLDRVAPRLADLPPIAAIALRTAVVARLARGEAAGKALSAARVFVDVTGRAASLDELLAREVRATTARPPYPATALGGDDEGPVLPLVEGELPALRKAGVRIADVTKELELDARAEQRARAPRVAPALAPEVRSACIAVEAFADGKRRGEIGILCPHARDRAGVAVLLDSRPLCTLKVPGGWPVVAVWNDDRLKPNRSRDGLAPAGQGKSLVDAVAARRDELLRAQLTDAPPDTRAAVLVDRAAGNLQVLGRLWLLSPGSAADLRIRWSGRGDEETRRPLFSSSALAGYPPALPVGGDVFVVADPPTATFDASHARALARLAVEELPALLAAVGSAEAPADARAAWDAALLGANVKPPPAVDASGKRRSAAEVRREIERRGCVWTTRHGGVAAGDFPSDAPAFVLLDDDRSPLLALLDERAPRLVRELGGLAAAPAGDPVHPPGGAPHDEPPAAPSAGRKGKRRRKRGGAPAAAPSPRPPTPAPREATPPSPPPPPTPAGPSWLSRVGSGMKELLEGGPRVALADDHPVRRAVLDAARRVGVEPPPAVVAAPRGRPIRFEVDAREVALVLDHPAVSALIARGELETLAAAAVGEMNRQLAEVSDAEEVRAVGDLLEARAARA